MVLVGKIKGLRQATTTAIDVALRIIEGLSKGDIDAEVTVVGLTFGALEIGGALGISKDIRFK